MAKDFSALLDELSGYDFSGMYNADFLHTWDKTCDELRALYAVAAALRDLRERNISPRIFNSGLPSRSSVTTPPARASRSPRPRTCWGSSSRTSTRARARSRTARPSARPPR